MVNVVDLFENMLPWRHIQIVLSFLSIDKFEVHDGRIIEAFVLVQEVFDLEARLDELAINAKQHSLQLVGFPEPLHACRVDVKVDGSDVLHPVSAERTIENFDSLSLAHFFY